MRSIAWIAFGIVSLGWILIVWFFASMVALSDASPKGSIAQNECARRIVREGRATDFFAVRDGAECRAVYQSVSDAHAKPTLTKGWLIAFGPVIVIGGLLVWRTRR